MMMQLGIGRQQKDLLKSRAELYSHFDIECPFKILVLLRRALPSADRIVNSDIIHIVEDKLRSLLDKAPIPDTVRTAIAAANEIH
jgi:hypothetical protein